MSYWLGVYILVVIAVAVPCLLLYLIGLVSWLAVAAVRFVTRQIKDSLEVRINRSKPYRGAIRHKAA